MSFIEKSEKNTPYTEIICALATPEGTSALSIIRLSGKGSFELVEGIMYLEKDRLRGMRRKVGNITYKDRIIDEVVAISWPEGKSFTGEEMVEIDCHGIPAKIREIIELLIRKGARRAEPGEFTRRAFVKGRMNAVQVITLAASWDEEKSEKGFTGKAEKNCRKMLGEIERTREIIEGFIEFGETYTDKNDTEIKKIITDLIMKAEEFRKRIVTLEKREKVVIMGPANSGKSTLFNLLTGKEEALVSDEPGTTRDGSKSYIEIRGRRIQLCDTAGTDGYGLDKAASEAVINGLDAKEKVIWMSEGVTPPDEVKNRAGEIIEVLSKSDINEKKENNKLIRTSSFTGEGIDELKRRIAEFPGSMSLTGAAVRIEEEIKKAMDFISSDEYDMAAELLNEAEIEARGIIGKGENILLSVERALAGMCVGK